MTKKELAGMRKIELREKPFIITGLPWVYETGYYDRIPAEKLPESCTDLFKDIASWTSGGIARIRTNAKKVHFSAAVDGMKTDLYHMARVSRSGFDFHIKYPNEERKFLHPSVPINYGHDIFDCDVSVKKNGLYDDTPERADSEIYELTIVFPTYNNVKEAFLYVEADAEVLPPLPQKYEKPFLFYGSSITQGACASRPSLCYTNRIALELETPIINFGFGGHAKGEEFMADLICEQDISGLEIDYDHNAPDIEHLRKTHEPFFRRIREKRPDLPIILTTKPDYGKTLDDNEIRRQIIVDTYEHAKCAGDGHVYFVDGRDFFTGIRDWTTVDGCHPNDLGFDRMVKAIKPAVQKVLAGEC